MEMPKKPNVEAIAAVQRSENKEFDRVIGIGDKLLFHVPEDIKFFREMTKGQVMIMGRDTFESMRDQYRVPVDKNDRIFVLSRRKNYDAGKAHVVKKEEVIKAAEALAEELGVNIFVSGGGQVYEMLLPYIQKAHITEIKGDKPGDSKFPELGDDFKETKRSKEKTDKESGVKYSFVTFERS